MSDSHPERCAGAVVGELCPLPVVGTDYQNRPACWRHQTAHHQQTRSAAGNDMAFPCDPVHTPNNTTQVGLTKRELVAAMAMQGILAFPNEGRITEEYCAKWAVRHADALIAALSETEKSI